MAACGAAGAARRWRRLLRVVTTVSPITNIVQNVGGAAVSITGIVPEGTNSHTFEPAPSDAAVMESGRHRLHERPAARGADPRARRGEPRRRTCRSCSSATRRSAPTSTSSTSASPSEAGDPNPHLWTNPLYAKRYAEIVRRRALGARPGQRQPVRAQLRRRSRPASTSSTPLVREVTETVPAEHRTLLTYHDSFPYFAREYGWRIIGAVQPSDFADPTPQEVAGPDRPDRGRADPGDLRLGGLPEPGARADRRRDRRDLRRRSARRRPARGSRRPRSQLPRPDGVRLPDVHGGARRRRLGRSRASTWRTCRKATRSTD